MYNPRVKITRDLTVEQYENLEYTERHDYSVEAVKHIREISEGKLNIRDKTIKQKYTGLITGYQLIWETL